MAILYICHEKGSKILQRIISVRLSGFHEQLLHRFYGKICDFAAAYCIFRLLYSLCDRHFVTIPFLNKSEMFVISNMQQLQQRHSAAAVLVVLVSTNSLIQPLLYSIVC